MAPQEQQLSDRIQAFFTSQGLASYGDLYSPRRQTAQPASLHRTGGKQRARRSGCNQSTGKGLREGVVGLAPAFRPSNATRTACSTSSACCTVADSFGSGIRVSRLGCLSETDRPATASPCAPHESRRPEQSGSPYHDRGRAPGRRRGQGRLAVETIESAVRCSGCPLNRHVVRRKRHPHKSRPSNPPVTLPT